MSCTKRSTQLGLPTVITHDLVRLSAGILHEPRIDATQLATGNGRTESQASSRVEVRKSPGKGFGLFAVDRIPAYAKVLEDDALISLARGEDLPQLWEKYCLLPTKLKESFDKLSFPTQLAAKEKTMISKLEQRGYGYSEAQSMARINSRWQANAFKTSPSDSGSPESHRWSYSLFGMVARINHSCTPNAHAHYRPSGSEIVYAVRDIEAGEEIEITYFDMTMAVSDRQARARSWGFQCSCPACSETGSLAATDYEQRLLYVHRRLSRGHTVLHPETMIDSAQVTISSAESADYPWLVIALPKLYLSLFNLLVQARGRKSEAREALEKSVVWEEKITGVDSPFSQQRRKALIDFNASSNA